MLYAWDWIAPFLSLQKTITYRKLSLGNLKAADTCKCFIKIAPFLVDLEDITPEKAMAPHSSTLVWRIRSWTEEPGRLQSMGSLGVRHDWATSLSLFTFMHWRRKWQPTPVLAWRIPGTGEPGGLLSLGSHRVRQDKRLSSSSSSRRHNSCWDAMYP